jgi:hypothetical protein
LFTVSSHGLRFAAENLASFDWRCAPKTDKDDEGWWITEASPPPQTTSS